ncbi:chondroitin AC/alginate lyase [Dactylonectria macrodidyma]|uniref:Chondroitin AC/alginate lyase n=1 Tax=Dactylonectria macrodidyma TaxID=307937 RepID=A0A9P9DM54_9HYPO|nr:chondroitin AC/alginate lyase [Dactylonectria macrodidyma]
MGIGIAEAKAIKPRAIVHPGLLHTNADFTRMKKYVTAKTSPQYDGWLKLSAAANADYTPSPKASVCRGASDCTQNYPSLYRDIAAAYANALVWKISGTTANADAAARILDAWSSTLTEIIGSADRWLAAGLYGYQLANVAEILRGYSGWTGLDATVDMLVNIFYPMNHDFLVRHNGAAIDNYWANWDLCTLCAIHSIGVLSDNQTMVNEAITYFKTGSGMGALANAIWYIWSETGSGKALGQGQEAGRDQGHATLDFALLGVLAQQSYNQGNDLFALSSNRILAGSEYAFKYNVGQDVPFKTYTNVHGTATAISNSSRGTIRPIGELLYAHYNGVKNLNASWTKQYRDLVLESSGGVEGGGGNYGSTSGGYDQLGWGTILYRLD